MRMRIKLTSARLAHTQDIIRAILAKLTLGWWTWCIIWGVGEVKRRPGLSCHSQLGQVR